MLIPNLDVVYTLPIHKPPLSLFNYHIIPTHLPLPHAAVGIKSPILETVAPLPLHAIVGVAILVPELGRYLIVVPREQLFAETVVLLFLPFLGQEFYDLGVAGDELVAVAPDAGFCVGFHDLLGVSGGMISQLDCMVLTELCR